ncbi:MAG TPA: S8 family peptidase [Gemmatimonadaceae bacterium]|nr:S8 family peptidase [Gemmatimonadaceae bacterium]
MNQRIARRLAASAIISAAALSTACADNTPTAAAPDASELPSGAGSSAAGSVIPGRYIVTLRDDVDDVPAYARRVLGAQGGSLRATYAHALRGFTAEMSAAAAASLAHDPRVAAVEPDRIITVSTTQTSATWGLDRVDQRSLPLSGSFAYTGAASAVRAYIIDTGLQSDHPEFGGRAMNVYDGLGGTGEDCNGHGTHVAGTVGSISYGVAKEVMLRGVRVFDCSGSTATSNIIAGVEYVTLNHVKPAVANLSVSGPYSYALNTAVMNLVSAGVFVSVAAGNENTYACNRSPASASTATTVAATTSSDYRASYSNYGSCVDLYAPGSSITSTFIGSGTAVMSGTSMASPHVAGVAALYKGTFGDSAQYVIESWLKTKATASVVKGNVTGTPNKLLFKAGL